MAKNRMNPGRLSSSYMELQGRYAVNRSMYDLVDHERRSAFLGVVVFDEQ